MSEITKEAIQKLNERIDSVNSKIVESKTKANMAKERIKELSASLGIDIEGKSIDEIKAIVNDLEAKEKEKLDALEKQVQEAETILNNN